MMTETQQREKKITEASQSRQAALNAQFIKYENKRSYFTTVLLIIGLVAHWWLSPAFPLDGIALALLTLAALKDWFLKSETVQFPEGEALTEFESKLEAEYSRYFDELTAAGFPCDKNDIKRLVAERVRMFKR